MILVGGDDDTDGETRIGIGLGADFLVIGEDRGNATE